MTKQIYEKTLTADFKRIPKLFSHDDFSLLIDSLDKLHYPLGYYGSFLRNRNKALCAFLFYCGLRPKEACKLRYDDFNTREFTFLIRGENNKEHKDRLIPLPKELIPFLENYLKLGRFSKWLFPSFADRNKPLSSQRWKAIFRETLKKSGLYIPSEPGAMPRTRSYSLRASFATRLLEESNGDFSLVAQLLGHSDYRSLTKYVYLSQLKGEKLERARRLM